MHQSFINAILFALADRNGFDYMGNRSVAIKMFVNDFHNAQSIKSGFFIPNDTKVRLIHDKAVLCLRYS